MRKGVAIFLIIVLGVTVGIGFRLRFPSHHRQIQESHDKQRDPSGTDHPIVSSRVGEGVAEKLLGPVRVVQREAEFRSIQFGRIDVTGIVADQFDQPLTNVAVEFVVDQSRHYNSKAKQGSTTTDHRGAFKISGYEGASIGILPKAEGYVLVATNNRVIYSGFYKDDPLHISNSGKHRIIRMWKLQGAENLIRLDQDFVAPKDTMPIRVDLTRGAITETGGDLALTVVRTSGTFSKESPGDWTLRITPVNGGIALVPFGVYRTTYEAPQDGYESSWEVTMAATNKAWFESSRETFFVKSKGGVVYSKFLLSFHVNLNEGQPVKFLIQGLVNPNGSRNWEEDPSKITLVGRQ